MENACICFSRLHFPTVSCCRVLENELCLLRMLSVCHCGLEDLNGISYAQNIVSRNLVIGHTYADIIWNIGNSVQVFKATRTNQKCSELPQFLPRTLEQKNGRKCDSEKQMQEFSMKFLHFLSFPVLEFLEMNCAGSERFRFVIVALKTWTEFPMFQILSTYVRLITKFQMLILSRS